MFTCIFTSRLLNNVWLIFFEIDFKFCSPVWREEYNCTRKSWAESLLWISPVRQKARQIKTFLPSLFIYIGIPERGDRLEIIWNTSQIKTVKEISESSFHSAFDVVFTQLYCLPNPNKTNSDEWLAKKCPVFESGLKSLRWWFVKRIDDILSESAAST